MEYVCEVALHTAVGPVIKPGVEGTVFTLTVKFDAEEEPHEFTAVTDIVPPIVPTVAVILFVVDDPVHPEGNVQLYDVAPDTADMV